MKLSSDFGEEYNSLPDDMSRMTSEWKKVNIIKKTSLKVATRQFAKTQAE